jgi:hypothetical protein
MAAHSVTVNDGDTRIATGSITCATTPDDIEVNIGFLPNYVRVWNVSSGGLVEFQWCYGQTNAYAFKNAQNGDASVITSLGITRSAVSDSYLGFKIGLDTDMNANGEILYFFALG